MPLSEFVFGFRESAHTDVCVRMCTVLSMNETKRLPCNILPYPATPHHTQAMSTPQSLKTYHPTLPPRQKKSTKQSHNAPPPPLGLLKGCASVLKTHPSKSTISCLLKMR